MGKNSFLSYELKSVYGRVSYVFDHQIGVINSVRIKSLELIDLAIADYLKKEEDFKQLDGQELGSSEELIRELELSSQHNLVSNQVPMTIMYSIIGSIYANLEVTLNKLVRVSESNSGSKVKFKHLNRSGSDLDRAINYFKLVQEIDFEDVKEELDQLDQLSKSEILLLTFLQISIST